MSLTNTLFLFYFLPVSVLIYFLLNHFFKKAINIYLIIISLIFYVWAGIEVLFYILFIVLLLYICGLIIEKYHKKSILFFAIVIIISFLGYFKYLNFIINNLNRFLHLALSPRELIVPLGISFITFEAISYLVDVYKNEKRGNLLDILLFISFFPKVSSGPIVSWKRFNKQINERIISLDKLVDGIQEFIIGLFKKVMIADILGITVLNILNRFNDSYIDSLSAVICILCYMVQIYYDFQGYSNMAIGMAKMFGFEFEKNFNEPYRSKSISEFWRRWHISLGTWFKEYIYIPLGGNRKHHYLNLLIVFLLTGIWHGAGFNFIIWGLLNGLIVIIERMIKDKTWYQKIPNFIKNIFVLIFIYFSWMSFCFDSLGEIKAFIMLIINGTTMPINFSWQYYLNINIIIILIFAVFNDLLIPLSFKEKIKSFFNHHLMIKYLGLLLIFLITIIYAINSSYSPFIYYRF